MITIHTIYPTILSFTTIPERLDHSIKVVKDILENLNGYQHLVINIPYKYDKWKSTGVEDKIKQFPSDPRLIVNRSDIDYGPITKLIPTLKLFGNKDYNLLIFDDNMYHLDAFKIIAEKQDKHHHKSFTFYKYNYKNVVVPQGVDIISFWSPHLKHIDYFINSIQNLYCKHVDDLVIARYLQNNGIEIEQLDRKWKWPWKPLETNSFSLSPSFSLFGLKGKYSRNNSMHKCYQHLK